MKIISIVFLFIIMTCKASIADSYFFKGCKLSNAVIGDYIINIEKNVIEVNLRSQDGQVQNYIDYIIRLMKPNQII